MKNRAFTLAEVLITLGIIGVVAALTLPPLIHNHKKHVIETRLKQNYSLLVNAVHSSEAYNGSVADWDYMLDVQDFIDKYLAPYIKTKKIEFTDDIIQIKGTTLSDVTKHAILYLPNGSAWYIFLSRYTDTRPNFAMIIFNIDNNKKNKIGGKNIFYFYILPKQGSVYNSGWGNFAWNVPAGGVYPDGYGLKDVREDALYDYEWRGCGSGSSNTNNAFCTSVVMQNNWKIPDNYPIKF